MKKIKHGVASPSWRAFLEQLPVVVKPTLGYLNLEQFATRAGVTRTAVRKAIREGRIARRHLSCTEAKRSGARKPLVDWNAAGYEYIAARDPQTWPPGFERNPEKSYRPIADEGDAPPPKPPRKVVSPPPGVPGVSGASGAVGSAAIYDLAAAKLRKEQLKVQQLEDERRAARNEVVPLDEVLALNREIQVDIIATLQKAAAKMAPLVVGVTVTRARAIIEEYQRKAMEALIPTDDPSFYTKE